MGSGPPIYARKKDDNQDELVAMILMIPGTSVTVLSGTGNGVPDLLVGEQVPLLRLLRSKIARNVKSELLDFLEGLAESWSPVIPYNWIFEVKDGAKYPSQRKLKPRQVKFFEKHRGQVHKVEGIIDILRIMGHMKHEKACLEYKAKRVEAGKGAR